MIKIKPTRLSGTFLVLWLFMLLASKKHIKILVSMDGPSGVAITPLVNNWLLNDTSKVIAQTVAIALRYRLKYERNENKEQFVKAYLLSQGWRVEGAG